MASGGNNAHTSRIRMANTLYDGRTGKIYPETEAKVLEIVKMISDGKTRETCVQYVMDSKGVGAAQARQYYDAAIRYLIPEDMDEFRKKMLSKNFKRLETIVEKGMADDRDLKLAKEAIAEINKMLGITGNKVAYGKENVDGSKEIIEISFD